MNERRAFPLSLLLALVAASAGCELVGDIFQAGMAVGVIVVVLALALVVWLVAKVRA
jgi:hypothetical protein